MHRYSDRPVISLPDYTRALESETAPLVHSLRQIRRTVSRRDEELIGDAEAYRTISNLVARGLGEGP